jgi:predicted  nucleic acid-binding Zn-ribbon protein
MWKQLAQFGKDLLTLKGQVKENTSEINEIRQELRDLTEFVRNLNNIVNQDRTKNEAQREILIEKLKNALLQFENDLLRGKYPNMLNSSKDDGDKKPDS